MKKIWLISIVFLANLAYASPENGSLNIKIKQQNIQAVGDFPYTLEREDKLLQLCLNYNYTQLGAYKVIDLKDFSTLKENKGFEGSSNPNNDFAMLDFIEKNAIFYKDNLPLHSDAITPPYNAIFARCMELYKSKKLTEFINSLEPPAPLDNK